MRDNTFKISYSRINAYLFCPQKYKLIYLENKYIHLNGDISFGISLHKTLEDYYKKGLYTYESIQDSLNFSWDSAGYENSQDVYVNYMRAQNIIRDFWQTYGKFRAKNVLTEKKFKAEIGKYPFVGIIDRIDENDDGTNELVDYKTHKKLWDSETLDNDLQLSLYCYACKTALGFVPEKIAVYFLSHNKKMYTSRNESKINEAIAVSLAIADRISDGDFLPDVSKCGFCDFKNTCQYSSIKTAEEQK